MQVTKGTWRMREQCVPGSLSSSPAREPGNEAIRWVSVYYFFYGPFVLAAASVIKKAGMDHKKADNPSLIFR